METLYKANLTKLNDLNDDNKFNSCMLTVSVGQLVHEGQKFQATLDLINRNFSQCTIGVCDTLQRHSLAILANVESDNLYAISKQAGDQWINRNIGDCDQILKIPYKLKRWDEWLQSPNYSIFRKKIDLLYQEDKVFKGIVDNLALEFSDRLEKRGYNVDSVRAIQLSAEYILEECAAMCLWYEEKYSVEVYPAVRNAAIEYGFSIIMQNHQYGKLVLPAGVKFKKTNSHNPLTSEIALKKILDVIPGHVYWKDLNGIFLGCNKRQAENYGFKNETYIIGKKDNNFLKEDIAQEIKANDQKIITNKLEEIIEENTYILSGKKLIKKTFLSHKLPMLDEESEVVGIVGISIDITEQKKLQRDLVKKTKALSLALDHKREFLNVLSHEIRTPLHIMGSIIEELHKNISYFSNKEISSFINVLSENNSRLMKLLTHLLDSAKTINGQNNYIFKNSNIVDTCIDCIKEFYNLADIKFSYNGNKDLVTLYDEIKISQVIRNIIDNAIKYGVSKSIKVNLELINNSTDILIKVENKGKKIKEEKKNKLFLMFFQGEEAKVMQKGVGLGLSICKEIIQAHKGKIWIDTSSSDIISVNFVIPFNS